MRPTVLQNGSGPTMRVRNSRLRGESGNTLVETALSIAVLMTLVVGIMEAGLAVYSYHFISNAAREGTRYAIVRGTTWEGEPWNGGACGSYTDAGCVASAANVSDYVKSLVFPGINADDLNVTTTWYDTFGGTECPSDKPAPCQSYGSVVQVQVQYNFPFAVPFIPRKILSMSTSSEMVIAQ